MTRVVPSYHPSVLGIIVSFVHLCIAFGPHQSCGFIWRRRGSERDAMPAGDPQEQFHMLGGTVCSFPRQYLIDLGQALEELHPSFLGGEGIELPRPPLEDRSGTDSDLLSKLLDGVGLSPVPWGGQPRDHSHLIRCEFSCAYHLPPNKTV